MDSLRELCRIEEVVCHYGRTESGLNLRKKDCVGYTTMRRWVVGRGKMDMKRMPTGL